MSKIFFEKPFRLGWGSQLAAIFGVVAAWVSLHWFFRDVFIFHDSWGANFPQVYEVAKNSACGQFAYWLQSNLGTPTAIYTISFSLTQPFRILLLNLWACSQPSPFDAMLIYKLQIFAIYFGFTIGMFVLGRVIYRHWLSALYLATAALFVGAMLASVHSDQVVLTVFWVPWCAAAWSMADRQFDRRRGTAYASLAVLFFCLQLLDSYPHIPALGVIYALAIYAVFRFPALQGIASQWLRLWPAALFVILTAGALYAIESQIFDYQPSQRTNLVVHPSQFGQSGFIQLSALFGSLFPLTFTSAYEEIAAGYGGRGFIFRLDVLVLYLGTLPLMLIISLIPRRGFRGSVLGWLIFAIVITLTALQTSNFYLLSFHLPFFDLFRSYFHFFDYAVVGFLVISGYGFDRLLRLAAAERFVILRSTLLLGGGFFCLGALALTGVAGLGRGDGPEFLAHIAAVIADAAIILPALGLIFIAARQVESPFRTGGLMIAGLVVTQSIHVVGIYNMLGEPSRAVFARYELDDAILTPLGAAELAAPTHIKRVACETKAGCNFAHRPAASLKTDNDGSYFRHRLNPVFRNALSAGDKATLVGTTHPILWSSWGLISLASFDALDREIETHRGALNTQLSKATYVVGSPTKDVPTRQQKATFSDMKEGTDRLSLRYRTDGAAFANISVNAVRGWTASIDGAPAPITRGLYNNITVPLPAGEGEVVLQYEDLSSRYLFWSRWALVILGLLGAVWLMRRATLLDCQDDAIAT